MKPMFNPSLMCMDFLDIKNQLTVLNTRADMYHFDIMDGHFVKNITLSPDIAKAMAPACDIPLDFHLLVNHPGDFIDMTADAVQSLTDRGIICLISPQAEVISGEAFRMIDHIKARGLKAGVVLNPETPMCMIESYMHKLDIITFMSIDPGFAGQKFIPETLDKVRYAKKLKEENPDKYHYIIQIDGQCNDGTFKVLAEAGVESFIVGTSGLFSRDPDLAAAWDKMIAKFNEAVNE